MNESLFSESLFNEIFLIQFNMFLWFLRVWICCKVFIRLFRIFNRVCNSFVKKLNNSVRN
jgi:hypothetical protein